MARADPAGWDDETAFANAINKAFRVKGGKPGPKFWKGVREAVMKLCGTQDLVCIITVSSLDNRDAHLAEGRHELVDLLGGEILCRQGRVQLVMSDIAALLAKLHQQLLRLLGGVGIWRVDGAFLRLDFGFGLLSCLGCHLNRLLSLYGRAWMRSALVRSVLVR